MNGIGSSTSCRIEDFFNIQVGLWRAYADSLICLANMGGTAIHLRINRYRCNIHLPGCSHNPTGDFSPIRDQYLLHTLFLNFSHDFSASDKVRFSIK